MLAVFHSYIFYPLLLKLFSRGKKQNEICFNNSHELPFVSVLLAVHNEEQVIERKIKTTLETAYPKNKLEFLIGDDSSTDATKEIVEGLANSFPQISFQQFNSRTGKAGIINSLSENAKGEVLLLTDANVFFTEETIFQLVKHFKNQTIALVAGNIQPHELKHDGISKQESFYQSSENIIKFREGILWGAMMGAFGGCYAIRKDFFTPTPSKFIVDDFFITMAAIEKGGYAINELNAVCYEDISNLMKEEFRRKSRIATGNFQIISRFFNLLSPANGGIAFAFLSHKVLRWF
ncbi:MAG: glycosyltransferase, partial [Chitinophagales bacterium]|nr:glycosyltransferase [Chitinophagales bacterium]